MTRSFPEDHESVDISGRGSLSMYIAGNVVKQIKMWGTALQFDLEIKWKLENIALQ